MKQRKHKISDAEFEILRVIWSMEQATVGEVHKKICELRQKPVTRNTVQVQLMRLVEKGRLRREQIRGTYVYIPTEDGEESRREIASDVTKRVFGGSISDLVKCLHQADDISEEDLRELESFIEQNRKPKS